MKLSELSDYALSALKYIYLNLLSAFFRLSSCVLKLNRKKIIFESFRGKSFSDSPLAVYEELAKDDRYSGWSFVIVCNNVSKLDESTLLDKKVKIVRYKSFSYFYHYTTSVFWIVNCAVPAYLYKSKSQKYFQFWHGIPIKRIGLDLEYNTNLKHDLKFMKYVIHTDATRIDGFITPSPYATEKLSSAFRVPYNRFLDFGYPRSDDLVINSRNENEVKYRRSKLGITQCKKVILYAPTYRDHLLDNPTDIFYQTALFLSRILGDEYVVLYRGHYYSPTSRDKDVNDEVVDVTQVNNVNDLILASDIVVTDYSSLLFDAILANKTIFIYSDDNVFYEEQLRGVYFDIESELGFQHYTQLTDLCDDITSSRLPKFNDIIARKYCTYEDGLSTYRFIKYLNSLGDAIE